LKNLIDLIQREGIKVIFTEPQFSPKIVKALTQETGVYASSLDPIGNELSSKGYEKMMRNNVKSIKEAFSRVADK
ncbi:MAG: metal ABC transporter substrate-binding protein, partial [Actinomycetota bacterium]|nr:metal ABC transporter substrate-binding protein [Actinomycetota bacterium]